MRVWLPILALCAGWAAAAEEPAMVAIPGGHFLMGSPNGEPGRFDTEFPQHPVEVKPFSLSRRPVSSGEFLVFLRDSGYQPAPCNPALGLGWHSPGHGLAYPPTVTEAPDWPATCLSWKDAQAYIGWLNGKTKGAHYRLPSEAEWEYAIRGGTATARWWGEAIGAGHANCASCGSPWDDRQIAPVGSFPANPFGIEDALGNVWDWVEDCWNESYAGAPADGSAWTKGDCGKRVLRGGSWSNLPVFIRSAARSRAAADGGDFDYSSYAGFRIAR